MNDVYGLGIRIGSYLQWSSMVLAFAFHSTTFSEVLCANCIYSLAVAIAYLVIRTSVKSHEVHIIAMMLSITLIFITLEIVDFMLFWRGIRSGNIISGQQEDPKRISTFRKYLRAIGDISWIVVSLFLLGVVGWQFWEGVNVAEKVPGCRPMLLWTHYMEPPYSTFLKACFIILVTLNTLVVAVLAYKILMQWSTGSGNSNPLREYFLRERTALDDANASTRLSVAFFYGLLKAFSVAYIETVIYQNRIQEVGSIQEAGQIIPFVTGICTFLFVIYGLIRGGASSKPTNQGDPQGSGSNPVGNGDSGGGENSGSGGGEVRAAGSG